MYPLFNNLADNNVLKDNEQTLKKTISSLKDRN